MKNCFGSYLKIIFLVSYLYISINLLGLNRHCPLEPKYLSLLRTPPTPRAISDTSKRRSLEVFCQICLWFCQALVLLWFLLFLKFRDSCNIGWIVWWIILLDCNSILNELHKVLPNVCTRFSTWCLASQEYVVLVINFFSRIWQWVSSQICFFRKIIVALLFWSQICFCHVSKVPFSPPF